MAKHVRKVLVCKALGATAPTGDTRDAQITNAVEGTLYFFDSKKNFFATKALAKAAFAAGQPIFVGTKVNADGEFYLSDKITNDKIESITKEATRAKANSVATITFGTPTVGKRYVLRIAYNDVTEMPIQFTQSFDIIANATNGASATTLADAFAAEINSKTTSAGRNARVTASAAAGVLTLTAKDITIDDKVDTTYEFHAIDIQDVTLTCDGVAAYTAKTVASADAGVGYWKVVRDIEKRALSYRGSMFFNDCRWNQLTGTQMVEKGKSYDVVDILYNNDYRSADNQFIKSTPLQTTIFIDSTATALADLADVFGATDGNESSKPTA